MNEIKSSLFLFAFLMLLSSCGKDQEQLTKELNDKLNTAIDSFSKNPNQPIDEVKKLSQLEYKTLVFPLDSDAITIDSQLNELGKDRWNCHSGFARPRSKPNAPELIILCSRTPETVLRFIPKGFIGR